MKAERCDVLLVGGGLANGLIAWRLRQLRPEVAVLLLEAQPTLGGRHTWSFHETDVDPAQDAWLAPLVSRAWRGHDVRFPGFARRLRGGYRSITSERFHRVVSAALGTSVRVGRAVRALDRSGATLDDGARVEAGCVIDGRGFTPGWLRAGVQRFLGLDLTLEQPHGLERPLLMDADVPQSGGFRFFYLLPWDERRLLVEETLYADDAAIDPPRARAAIEAYARGRGWRVASVDREEQGALAIPLAGDLEALWRALPEGVAASGVRAGLFNATTGYSLPDAVHVADALAARRSLGGVEVAAQLRALARASWERQAFLRLLNRMLFEAAAPERRVDVLARFYRLPEGLIERFYARRTTLADRVRLLVGKPPVPVGRALRCLRERPLRPRAKDVLEARG